MPLATSRDSCWFLAGTRCKANRLQYKQNLIFKFKCYDVMTSIRGHPDLNCRGGGGDPWLGGEGKGGMNLPFKVPLTLTSPPFPAVVPFSLPQNVSQIFKVPSTSGCLLPTLPFPTPFQGLPPSCSHQPRRFENHRLRPAIISLSFDIQTFWLEKFQNLSYFVYIFSLSQACDKN